MNIIAILHLPLLMFPSLWLPSNLSCKIAIGFKFIITQLHAWIVALCSLDRVISVMAPFKFTFKNKLKFQLIMLGILTLTLSILISPFVIYYKSVYINENQTKCTFTLEKELNWVVFYSKTQYILFSGVLPFLIMITSSILIVLTLCKSKSKVYRSKTLGNNVVIKRHNVREIQLAKSLITLDFFFILFKLPMLLYLIFFSSEDDGRVIYNFMYQLLLFISSTNIVCMFVIFFIINKLYRSLFIRYVKKIFGCKVIIS
jgi:hypothetical protein